MSYRELKLPGMILAGLSVPYVVIEFFAASSFSGVLIPLSMGFFLVTFLVFIAGIRFSFMALLKNAGLKNKFIGCIVGLLFAVSGCSVTVVAEKVHDVGLVRKFRQHDLRLTAKCEEILATKKENEHFWDTDFDLWPEWIGPMRNSIVHADGVVYIALGGTPDGETGICYNPKHKKLKKLREHLFGPWYEYSVNPD